MGCRALPCGTVRCCVVPCCVLCCTSSFVQARYHSNYYCTRYRYYTRFAVCTTLNHKKCTHSQLSSPPLYLSSTMRCHAVPCLALRCCAFFRTCSSTRYHAKYQIPDAGMDVCTRPSFLQLICPPRSFAVCFFLASYSRAADQNVTSPTSTQRKSISSRHYQIASCAMYGRVYSSILSSVDLSSLGRFQFVFFWQINSVLPIRT